ncbi:hypothetical protein N656DRAFT_78772 [Canariomyces notabilis]|uniref:Uncharacterized protein n=1 Tax=Canariomyces notabilis TaxID=2074819 RepID=A0AAN6TES1_9PEZI|nr:hypothetical protein N656DRAFT_78772 [Canariomyces arenarius]
MYRTAFILYGIAVGKTTLIHPFINMLFDSFGFCQVSLDLSPCNFHLSMSLSTSSLDFRKASLSALTAASSLRSFSSSITTSRSLCSANAVLDFRDCELLLSLGVLLDRLF